ncbi:MAG: hypothetical protein KGI60_00170 [Patescibacteria group bacterium]|nr:hypothetical protein [Patescibacteria group bacterium]
MKKLALAFAAFIACALPAQALHLDEAVKLLPMTNEQVVTQIDDDQFAAAVVAKIRAGQSVSQDDRARAVGYCAGEYALLRTNRMRRKEVRKLMKPINRQILYLIGEHYVHFDEFTGRLLSMRIANRLSSYLDFKAERYRAFLAVLGSG